ncbi:MAG: hypothetical protein ACI8RZ_002018 [Myxococcota bacterium]|jgi:hypothetical protein
MATQRGIPILWAASVALLFCSCASRRPVESSPVWAPTAAAGWEVRDIDTSESPSWVVYERDAHVADVKAFRLVGIVDAEPDVVMRAVRERLLDARYMPKGLQWQVLQSSESEIVVYGLMPAPFPMRDREATEHMVFSHDPSTGVHRMDSREVDTEEPVPRGALRIPVSRNTFVIAPHGEGQSVVTNDSVHDLGGGFPNWAIYGPVRKQLVEDLHIVQDLSVYHATP